MLISGLVSVGLVFCSLVSVELFLSLEGVMTGKEFFSDPARCSHWVEQRVWVKFVLGIGN